MTPDVPRKESRDAFIPLYQPDLTGNERSYVAECLDTNWISSKGRFTGLFEKAFSDFIGCPCTSACNGTAALRMALAAVGIRPGDEVIVPSLTYVASVNCIVAAGATPLFAEIEADTWQMDAARIEALVTPRTRAILAVHLYGNACDMPAIRDVASRRGLCVIEDCAESLGTTLDGRHAGTFGDAAAFSFYGNKTVTTGEGGMVAARDEAVLRRAAAFKTQGVSPDRVYWHESLGFNFRMTNIQAAIGLAQMERIRATLERKRALAAGYERRLAGLPLRFARTRTGVSHSHWMVSAVVDRPEQQEPLREALRRRGIETRPFFHPAHTLPMYARPGFALPISERVAASGLNLPSWPGLSERQLDRIGSAIRDAFHDDLR
ncbi:MAG: DegT/DnrJ/EryC1/StrS family aminotransferase [Planctomycetota bacterium]